MRIEERIASMGLYMPEAVKVPADIRISFVWVRVYGDRVAVAGHGPQAPDGTVVGPFGRVGAEISLDQAAMAARLATLAMLGSLKRAIDDLDRIAAWIRVDALLLAR